MKLKFSFFLFLGISSLAFGLDNSAPMAESISDDFNLLNQSNSLFQSFYEFGWRSRYVSQGIDNLPQGGIYTLNPSFGYRGFNCSLWYAIGDRVNFQELDIILSYPIKWGTWAIIPIYQQYFFLPNYRYSVVPSFSLEYNVSNLLTLGADANVRISDHRGNAYYDAFVRWQWDISPSLLCLSSLVYGFNGGYVSNVNEGSNTLDHRLQFNYSLNESTKLIFSFNYNLALSSLKQSNLGNQFWYGIYLNFIY